jgi:signal transduction histidine kinase
MAQDTIMLQKIEAIENAPANKDNFAVLQKIVLSGGHPLEILNAKIAIAHLMVALKEMDTCILYCQQEVAIAQSVKDAFAEANFYKLLGNAYYHYPQKEKAIIYWQKCLALSEPNKFNILTEQCTHNIGAVQLEFGKFTEAEAHLKRALQMGLINEPKKSKANNQHYRLLATLYNQIKRYDEAEKIFLDIIQENKVMKDTFHLIETMIFYTAVLRNKKQQVKAMQVGTEALQMSRNTSDYELISTALSMHVQNLKAIGKFQEACTAYTEMDAMVRKKFDKDLNVKIGEAEAKFHTAEIEHEKDAAISQAKKEKQFYLFTFFSLIGIGTSAIYFYNQKRKQKIVQQLQQERIQAVLDGEEKERARIAKDLHDGIVQDLTAIKLQLNNSLQNSSIDKMKLEDIVSDIDKASVEVRNISYQMMPATLQALGFTPAIEDLFKRVLGPATIKYEIEQIGLDTRLPENVEVNLFRITQELLNNALKHSKADFISLLLHKKTAAIHLIFEDNGIGFEEEKIVKGIGLNSLSSRVELLHGSLQYEKSEGRGTIAIIKIPL